MKYKIPVKISVLWLSIFCLMMVAGFWQLDRAEQKTIMFAGLQSKPATELTTLEQINELPLYSQLSVSGKYADKTHFFHVNQVYKGTLGFHLFTPFYLNEIQAWVMINRGWLKQSAEIDIQALDHGNEVTLEGIKSNPPGTGFQLGEMVLKDEVAQDITYFDESLIYPFLKDRICEQNRAKQCIILPFIIKLNPSQTEVFVRDWKTGLMPPEKHVAYSVQWFSMSAVLLFLFILFLRKINASTNKK